MLWVPPGFAHGFLALSECADFLYKTTDYWYPQHERTLLWNDPALGDRLAARRARRCSRPRTPRARRSRRPTSIRSARAATDAMSTRPSILLTGATGQLGFELARLLRAARRRRRDRPRARSISPIPMRSSPRCAARGRS